MLQSFREKMEAELRELNAKIEILRAKASKAEANKKIEFQEEFENLEKKKEAFQQKVEDMKGSTSLALEDVKMGVESAYRDLKRGLDSAVDKFK